MFINRPDENYVGLFYIIGYASNPAVVIKDLNLANVSIVGKEYVGGLIAAVEADDKLQIENCSVTGNITGTNWVGGIAGILRGIVTGCHTNVNVSSSPSGCYTGGLAGQAYRATITNCRAFGNVAGYRNMGGLLGYVQAGNGEPMTTAEMKDSSNYSGLWDFATV